MIIFYWLNTDLLFKLLLYLDIYMQDISLNLLGNTMTPGDVTHP